MVGEKDDDYGYILFSLPERRGEINIILSRGNLYSSKDIENWGQTIIRFLYRSQ